MANSVEDVDHCRIVLSSPIDEYAAMGAVIALDFQHEECWVATREQLRDLINRLQAWDADLNETP
jgi:hypothetical protein